MVKNFEDSSAEKSEIENAEVKTESNAEVKTESNAEVKTESNSEVKTESNAEVKTEFNDDVKTKSKKKKKKSKSDTPAANKKKYVVCIFSNYIAFRAGVINKGSAISFSNNKGPSTTLFFLEDRGGGEKSRIINPP